MRGLGPSGAGAMAPHCVLLGARTFRCESQLGSTSAGFAPGMSQAAVVWPEVANERSWLSLTKRIAKNSKQLQQAL